jgi:hypothetical protein
LGFLLQRFQQVGNPSSPIARLGLNQGSISRQTIKGGHKRKPFEVTEADVLIALFKKAVDLFSA